jgi:hypothetical protein
VLADPEYGYDLQQIAGYRTLMGAPMLVDGEVVGDAGLYHGPWAEQCTRRHRVRV